MGLLRRRGGWWRLLIVGSERKWIYVDGREICNTMYRNKY